MTTEGRGCKAVIFDINGNEIASASARLNMITPQAGFTERNMDELWQANCKVIREVISKSDLKAEDIKGMWLYRPWQGAVFMGQG